MPLNVTDILDEVDILALDGQIASDFGSTWPLTLADKRRVAVEDIVGPMVAKSGYPVALHLTRKAPDAALGYTGAAYTDIKTGASDKTADDLTVNSIIVTPSTDAIYLGMREPYKGLYVAAEDDVNTTSAVNSITYWNGGKWQGVNSLVDGTQVTAGKSMSGGGRIRWSRPDDWVRRTINGSEHLFWVRLQMSAQPSDSTKIGGLLPIMGSMLTTPAAYLALGMMYEEAAGGNPESGYVVKSERSTKMGYQLLDRVLPLIRNEFDVDESQAVERTEVNSLTPDAGEWVWERG